MEDKMNLEDLRLEVKRLKTINPDFGCRKLANELGETHSRVQRAIKWLSKYDPEFELLMVNTRLAKDKQRLLDSNRIERKAFREYARIENAVVEYSDQLREVLEKHRLHKLTKSHPSSSSGAGIFHITDPHMNELIELSFNRYDFGVASQRMQKMVSVAKTVFGAFGVQNVLVAMTGDLLNSDRRMDELLNGATNRSQATFLAVDILQQTLLDLNKDYNLSVVSVSGNESRIRDEIGHSDLMATDNYDATIFNVLEYIFREGEGIEFVRSDPWETVAKVGGKSILIIHGHEKLLLGNVEQGVIRMIGKWSERGYNIDFVIFGHLHYARIGEVFARGASLAGANTYTDRSLHLITKASQNIHVITAEGDIHSMKVDLQNTEGIPGYNIDKSIEAYHPKSARKIEDKRVVMEVVV